SPVMTSPFFIRISSANAKWLMQAKARKVVVNMAAGNIALILFNGISDSLTKCLPGIQIKLEAHIAVQDGI
ncbi:MAG: hypothetical protein ACAH10_11535, partial [Methylophilaceae bacterium]